MTGALVTLSVLTTGLVAGLFAAFGYAVMPGLRGTDDHTFVGAMRGINVAILNPVFGVLFGGALLVLIGSTVALRADAAPRPWIVAALGLYLLTLLVTAAVNVPLNDRLEAGTAPTDALRTAFENRWVAWNVVRALFSTGSFAAATMALARLAP